MEASLDRPSIYAVLFNAFDNLFEVFNTLTTRHKVVCRVTNQDRHIVAASLVNLVDDLGEQTAAVFSRSTIFVGTMVGVLRNEAHYHVANTSMNFNDVNTSSSCSAVQLRRTA